MIKFFRNQDIIVTSFTIAKEQTLNSVLNDLILANEGDDLFPLVTPIASCNNNVSGSCAREPVSGFLAISQFLDPIDFQIGKYVHSSSVFYPSGSAQYNAASNPMNLDGTYQRQVFNTVQKMYYNNYNNAYNIFGFDGYDTDGASLHLTNDFSALNLRVDQTGDKIRPNTLVINNQSGDIPGDIVDDGNYNLRLSGSFFINKYGLISDSDDLAVPVSVCGLGSYLANPSMVGPCCPTEPVPPGPVPPTVAPPGPVSCNTLFAYGFSSPAPYYYDYEITLGSGTGVVTLTYSAYAVPDMFEIIYDGVTVVNTGWRTTAMTPGDPIPELAAYGFSGAVCSGDGDGTAQFVKTTTTPTATLRIYSPLPDTYWVVKVGCPA